jgi:hypothetical protein
MKEMNKKGQQMTLGTIIAIVLGITVLVFLIWGFSTGWSNMWNKITAFGGGSANIDTIVQACALDCSTQNKNAYCTEVTTLNTGDYKIKGSCKNFEGLGYGISCTEIDCGDSIYKQSCEDLGGKWLDTCSSSQDNIIAKIAVDARDSRSDSDKSTKTLCCRDKV